VTEYWRGDAETGDKSQWCRQTAQTDSRIQVVTNPISQGNYAYRMELRYGDNPSGCRSTLASGPTSKLGTCHLIKSGDEAFYGWSVFLPSDSVIKSDKWRLVLQFKGIGSGSPPVSLNLNNDAWILNNRPTTSSGNLHIWKAPARKDVWEKFMMHIKWSENPKIGFLELYYNDGLVLPQKFTSTIHIKDGKPVTNFVALGLYRDSSIKQTDILYHDGFVAGQSYEEVKQ
jgi:hypothetical protein